MPLPRLEKKPSQEKRQPVVDRDEKPNLQTRENGTKEAAKPVVQARPAKVPRLTEKDLEAIRRHVAEIDRAEKSDVEDDSSFQAEYRAFIARNKKRAMEADILESHKSKVYFSVPPLFFCLWDKFVVGITNLLKTTASPQ